MTGAAQPQIRLDVIAQFRAWSAGMGLAELFLRKKNHPQFSTLTSAEMDEARRQIEAETEIELDNIRNLAAEAAWAITLWGGGNGA